MGELFNEMTRRPRAPIESPQAPPPSVVIRRRRDTRSVHRPVPRASVGRGLFVPNLAGWIKNATSALPGGRSSSPFDRRSQGMFTRLHTHCKQRHAIPGQKGRKERALPTCSTQEIKPGGVCKVTGGGARQPPGPPSNPAGSSSRRRRRVVFFHYSGFPPARLSLRRGAKERNFLKQ
jgi:hypothetical protein